MAVFWLGTLPVLVSLGVGVQKLLGFAGGYLPVVTSVVVIAVGLRTLVGRAGIDVKGLMERQSHSASASPLQLPSDVSNSEATPEILRLQELNNETPACCEDDAQ